jgi:preprotein translocase subunit SecA
MNFLRKLFPSRNERVLKKLWPIVHKINEIYDKIHDLKDEDLIKKTEEWKKAVQNKEVTLDEILPEAYAYVKEACRRLCGKEWEVVGIKTKWDMIPFDVQLLGAIVLHQGKIAEMATGEGKTLVATMPLYLNALTGRNCHLVTVNDYLARRDREWMGPVYESLGISVGVIQAGMEPHERRPEYEKDITYGTNNEFGFDYLRDNMVFRKEDKVQRGHYYAIVDEIDSILIDEARTPLIISGPVERSTNYIYVKVKGIVEDVVRKQNLLINNVLQEAEKLLKEGKKEEAAKKLLLARRGSSKIKKTFQIASRT